MSNKHNAIIIGLASVTLFTACVAGTNLADQSKRQSPKTQPANHLTQPETLGTTDAAAAKQTPVLPVSPAADIPAAVLPPPKMPDAAALVPFPSQPASPNSATMQTSVAPIQSTPAAPATTAKTKTTKTKAS